MAARRRRRGDNGLDAWPGYVDALSTLLMVIIFVLLVFILAQGVLTTALSGRDRALEELRNDLAGLRSELVQERGRVASLTAGTADLERQVAQAEATRRSLTRQVEDQRELANQLTADRDRLVLRETDARLALDAATAAAERLRGMAAQATERAETTAQERDSLRNRLGEAERQVAELDRTLRGTTEEAVREREAARTRLADAERRLAELDRAMRVMTEQAAARLLAESRLRESAESGATAQAAALLAAREELASLRRDLEAQRREAAQRQAELARVAAALDLAQSDTRARETTIAELEQRLNVALLDRMEQLRRYRSEFFGRVREVLENRAGIQVVGDRFVFQSEVLFPVGSYELTAAGREQIGSLAQVVLQIASEIPKDINWVLRVDGHSDRSPVRGSTNWELSSSRAITVVKYLIAQGLPAERLAATAFAEFQPLTDEDTPEARARNRRIELRFTDR